MRIAILAYDGISPFMLSTPLAVFGEPFLASGHEVLVCSGKNKVEATGGLAIETPFQLTDATSAEIVILPSWRNAKEPVPPVLTKTLRRAANNGALVTGLCLGAFGLAEAGLLDGMRATTHWAQIDEFARRFPKVKLDPEALYVDEGQLLTSAGIASGLDCCLHLLARISGTGEANRVARHLVVAPQRHGTQPQHITRPATASSADQRVSNALQQIWANPIGQTSLDELAQNTGMSRRSLSRHIRDLTGSNLGGWLRRARLARAEESLILGSKGLEQIAERSGFPDAGALRTAFRAEYNLTPSQWLARQKIVSPPAILPKTRA